MIDLHTHVLPGIDDGAHDWDKSLEIIRVAAENGITAIAATPHQHSDGLYCNRNTKVRELLCELRQRVATEGLGVTLHEGGEVLVSPDLVERIENGTALLYEGGKFLLLEFPSTEVPVYAHQVVFDLVVKGITPVIAHPERNEGFAKAPELLYELVEAGALAQMTASSISSHTNTAIQELATLFLTHNLVHVMASDTHSPNRRPPILGRYAERIGKTFGEKKAEDMTQTIPSAILRGDMVETPQLVPLTKQSRKEAQKLTRQLVEDSGGRGKLGFGGIFRLPWT